MKQTLAAKKTFRLEQARETSRKVRRTQLYFDERIFPDHVSNIPPPVGAGVPFSVCRLVTIATTGCQHAEGEGLTEI